MEKLGIENLKKVVLLGVALGSELERTFSDGKFKLFEAFNFFDEFKDLANLIPLMPNAKEEFNDLDESERTEIILFVRQKLKLENAWAEKLTESALDLAASTWVALQSWKDYRNREK